MTGSDSSAFLTDIDTRLDDRTGRTSLSGESQGRRRYAEIRVRVETLVRRVVPDEIRECFTPGIVSSILLLTHGLFSSNFT